MKPHHCTSLILSLWAATLLAAPASTPLPDAGGDWTPLTPQRDGSTLLLQRPPQSSALRFKFQLGSTTQGHLLISKRDGTTTTITLNNRHETWQPPRPKDATETPPAVTLSNAMVSFHPLVTRHVRPHLRRYTNEQQQELAARWESLPPASQHWFTLELRQQSGHFERYLDGHYIGTEAGEFDSVKLTCGTNATIAAADAGTSFSHPRYLPLAMWSLARPGIFSNAVTSVAHGLREINDIPMLVAAGSESADVGQARQMKGSWALECDEHLARTALDAMPESVHAAVPNAFYTRAWALCAVAPDPQRDPVVSLKVTRYATSGRGGAIAIDTVTLPRSSVDPLPAAVQQVGTLRHNATNLPLYLVRFDLQPGAIIDLLSASEDRHASMMSQPYLDIDFIGQPGSISAQWDSTKKPDNKSTSSVHLFAVTLERMPFALRLLPQQPGNIFHNDEPPVTEILLTAQHDAASGDLTWSISGADGKQLRQRHQRIKLARAGDQQRLRLPLETKEPGWYGLHLSLASPQGDSWLQHEAAFAQLGRDTRRAGYESPFGTWWFGGAHYSGGEVEIAGPMLFKAGLRKTTMGWSNVSEADFAPWQITLNQIGWSIRPRSLDDPAAAQAEIEAKLTPLLQRFPHCNAVTIFHESYNSRLPPELVGEERQETPAEVTQAEEMARLANFMGEFFRKRYPHIKLLVGNTTHSAAIITALLRHGLKPEYIDAIGMETVGQTSMPEKLWAGGLQGIWLGREAARRLGHDLPVDGCYEFTARSDRTLGQQRQAEFYVRDILISLAYGFERVSPGILMDTANAYYNTLWGAGGICQRYPLLYPKKAYVGIATATRLLDSVTFAGQLDTGSRTLYALRFKRQGGGEVVALWTTVGTATVEVEFAAKAGATLTGFFGAAERLNKRRHTINVTTAPCYLTTATSVTSARLRQRRYAPPPATFKPLAALTTTNEWQLAAGDPWMKSRNPELPYRQPGNFTLTAVDDPVKQRCLELELIKEGTLEALISEYTFLQPAAPLDVPGRPTDIGLWVCGDSGWGKIVFEIEDAKGRVWRTEGAYHDWPGDLAINFDGWRFIRFPLDGSSSEINISPTSRWTGAPGTPHFPLKLRGFYAVLNRQGLNLTEMEPAPAKLRFQEIGFVY